MKKEILCPACSLNFSLLLVDDLQINYCPVCGHPLKTELETTIPLSRPSKKKTPSKTLDISFLTEHLPHKETIQFSIGPYQVLESIGKGGMGEVFLAYDTTCGRRVALKKIRPDLIHHTQLHQRFLKEARITSQLTHPAIIPIYAIHSHDDISYYTMPFIQGETLKQLLKKARIEEKKGEKPDHLSIPALIRMFLNICQAVAYAHSKGVLHRDLKPENIIVGHYGQIIILDWGLAKMVKGGQTLNEGFDEAEEESYIASHQLTHVGKVVGTISHMAPERALGNPANFQTDIYSLGVILYQLLTLRYPFQRTTLREFRKNMQQEKLVDPTEIAPYRDVPQTLSRVVLKCLSSNTSQRYETVDALVHDLENYIEGRSEWFQIAELNTHKKEDWEFQENVLIAEHIALTRETEVTDWVSLMISRASFQENIKIEATVKIGEQGNGIGFLLSIPEAAEREHLNDGYCLWIGSDSYKSTKLLRSTVEVMHAPEVFFKRHETYHVVIEKIETNLYFYLNNILQFSYISHLPLAGTHIGLLARDADFEIKNFLVYIGSQNITVNCLAVPDAFLAHKDYTTALNEYRRIGYSFPGRAEGREAMFRAGITLLEQANTTQEAKEKAALYDLAHEEFGKLHGTPGGPLEYLGKALIYEVLNEYEEEAKCFELAFRRYPQHPLLPVLQEQIIYRMHNSSRKHRQATFNFLLLTLMYLPEVASSSNTQRLLTSLNKNWEPLFFISPLKNLNYEALKNTVFALKIAFWLARPYVISYLIEEILNNESPSLTLITNALFCLAQLGAWEIAQEKAHEASEILGLIPEYHLIMLTKTHSCAFATEKFCESLKDGIEDKEKILYYLFENAIDQHEFNLVHILYEKVLEFNFPHETQMKAKFYEIWALLLEKNWEKAGKFFQAYTIEELSQENSILHFLYGCWLYITEGREIAFIHFSGVFEVAYPRTWTLFSYYLKGKISIESGFSKLFPWERRQLYRQLSLFYHCTGNQEQFIHYQELTKKALFT